MVGIITKTMIHFIQESAKLEILIKSSQNNNP